MGNLRTIKVDYECYEELIKMKKEISETQEYDGLYISFSYVIKRAVKHWRKS